MRLGWIAQPKNNFGGPDLARLHLNYDVAAVGINAPLVFPFAGPLALEQLPLRTGRLRSRAHSIAKHLSIFV